MIRLTLALLVAGLAPLVAAAATSGTFEAGSRGHVLVPVSVNGGETRPFAVDTAASQTVLDAGAYSSVNAEGSGAGGDAAHASGAHGGFTARGARLESLRLWQAEQQNQFAAVMLLADLTPGRTPDFAGVLGLPFLARYRIDLDYPARRLALHEQDGELPGCDFCTMEAATPVSPLIGGLPSVPVTVNGVRMTALLDTGASRTILNEPAISALGLTDTGAGEAVARLPIALGSLPAREHEVSRIDLPVFRTLRLADQPAMILGIDYLAAGRMVLDLAAGLVWFKPASD